MNLSESYIKRLQGLSGIKLNEVELKATSGRSDKGTLGYFVEEYILELGESILNDLGIKVKEQKGMTLAIPDGSLKMSQNSLLMPFEIVDASNPNDVKKTAFSLSLNVNLESSSNTTAVLKYGTLNDEFNLQSKHSKKDIDDFIGEIAKRVLNVPNT